MSTKKHPIVVDLINKIKATSEHNYTMYPLFPATTVVRKNGQTIQEVVDYEKPHLNITSIILYTGIKTAQLEVINGPDGAEYTWTSDNTKVVTVNNGLITRKGAGTARVYCSFQAGNEEKILTCEVIGSAAVARVLSVDYDSIAQAAAKAVANNACLVPLGTPSYTLSNPNEILKVRNDYADFGAKITVKAAAATAQSVYALESEEKDGVVYYSSKPDGEPTIEFTNSKGVVSYSKDKYSFSTVGTYRLLQDIDVQKTFYFDCGVLGGNIVFDFDGHTLTANKDTVSGWRERVSVLDINRATVTIKGNGKIIPTEDSELRSVGCWGGKVVTIEDGEYYGCIETMYAAKGTIEIKPGVDKVVNYGYDDGKGDPYRYTLNCLDANYQAGTAGFKVSGGTFYKFDPSNSPSETPSANFLVEGYKSTYDEAIESYRVEAL